jgi:hypothetical protein
VRPVSTPVLFVGTNLLAALATSTWLAAQYDDVLTHAAVAAGEPKSEMKSLADRIGRNHRKVFNTLGPMRKARLICFLGERARKIPEIEAMAPPIAMLWVVHRKEMESFVIDFDRLLRLWRLSATEAMSVADKLTAMYKSSPMTLQEALDSLIAVAESFPPKRPRGGHSFERET